MLNPDISEGVEVLLTDSVVRHMRDLPSLPAVVLYLCQTLNETNVDANVLAEKMALDPALTAKTLRMANSALYGPSREIRTVKDAMMVLGFQTLRTLLVGGAIRERFPQAEDHAFDADGFWRHTIATSALCRILAERSGRDGAHAITAGMLHDIGCLVLVCEYPDDYNDVIARYRREGGLLAEAERETLGVDHIHIGTALAAHWHFPVLIQEAIAFHHQPAKAAPFSLAGIVHVADALAHVLEGTVKEEALEARLAPEGWALAGVSADQCDDILAEGKRAFRGIFSALF